MKVMLVSILLLQILLSVSASDNYAHFYETKVLRAKIVEKSRISLVEQIGADVWSHGSNLIIGENDIMVNSTQEETLKSLGIQYEVMIGDVEQLLENERQTLQQLASEDQASWFATYHTYDEIVAFYQNLTTSFPELATFVSSVGTSLQGKVIPAVILGSKTATKKVYIEGGQHAREWVGPSTVAFIASTLLNSYATDSVAKAILDGLQIVVVPIVNPDGYAYSWTTNRLWRKNRRANSGGSYGVDLNRNWDDHFGGDGSSSNPNSETYHGLSAFSEPETLAVSKFITANGPFILAVDYHSYSQLILRPYGWSRNPAPNEAVSKLVGDGIRDAIRGVHSKTYTSEASWELYITSGSAQDWWYSEAKVPFSYTIELRDTGAYGFVLPPAQIIPTGEENYAAFLYYSAYVLKN